MRRSERSLKWAQYRAALAREDQARSSWQRAQERADNQPWPAHEAKSMARERAAELKGAIRYREMRAREWARSS